MNGAVRTETGDTMAALVHDLRQPLGTMEYSVSYLQMLLGDNCGPVHQQLRVIQQQIDLAARILTEAAGRVSRPSIQCAAGESLDLTKSEIAAVT